VVIDAPPAGRKHFVATVVDPTSISRQRAGRRVKGENVVRTRLTWIGFVSILAATLLALSAPAVPTALSVPGSQRLTLKAKSVGVQIYTCRADQSQPSGMGTYAWILKAPEATLFDERGMTIGKHYEGPTWELNDGSKVVGAAQTTLAPPSGDGIPWLLLKAVRNDGAGVLTPVRTIQRVETFGGKAPASGCDMSKVDSEVRIPYGATYYFYVDKT
jgi:hypothetical protein